MDFPFEVMGPQFGGTCLDFFVGKPVLFFEVIHGGSDGFEGFVIALFTGILCWDRGFIGGHDSSLGGMGWFMILRQSL